MVDGWSIGYSPSRPAMVLLFKVIAALTAAFFAG